jgi:hypothetical protein
MTIGIEFGNVSTLPAYGLNGSHNYDGDDGGNTTYWMNVSADSNTNVDFCIKATALNTSDDDEIGLGNETYHNTSAVPSFSDPNPEMNVSLTTEYVKAGNEIEPGNASYYRFWLDVPAGTAAGTYNNSVQFKGVNGAGSC